MLAHTDVLIIKPPNNSTWKYYICFGGSKWCKHELYISEGSDAHRENLLRESKRPVTKTHRE